MASFDRTEQVVHFIDSIDRSSGTNENFVLTLSETLGRVKKVEITHIEVPYSFYVITAANNTIDYKDSGSTALQASITPGNYSGTSFATEIQNQLNVGYPGWTVVYSSSTYKLSFSHSSNFELNVTSTASSIIGLLVDSGVTTNFTCQGISDLSGPNYILVKSNRLTRPMRRKPILGSSESDVLHKIQVNSGPGIIITDQSTKNNPYIFPVRQSLSTIDFRLEDPDGNVLDLNGLRWSIRMVYDIL